MARGGLEPPTPRFSVGTSSRRGWAKSLENNGFLRDTTPTLMLAVCGLFADDVELARVIRDAVWRKELKHHINDPGFAGRPERCRGSVGERRRPRRQNHEHDKRSRGAPAATW
jgi:hypothetical protein